MSILRATAAACARRPGAPTIIVGVMVFAPETDDFSAPLKVFKALWTDEPSLPATPRFLEMAGW